jgi:nucleoside-diphosphate-sugar epimerase
MKRPRQVLAACHELGVKKLFCPSTIAVFVSTTPKNDWGWKPEFDLDGMTRDMLAHV